jgi:two-component system, cell cycle sensor histidine kinase and response regulator CckA
MCEQNQSDHLANLRQQAGSIADTRAPLPDAEMDASLPDQIRQMLHDLRVHEIELEMQNEELRQTQAELDASRARYFDLYNLAPVGYCTLTETGLFLEANLTAAMLLNIDRSALVRQAISRFIFKEDLDFYYLHHKRLFETGQPQVTELRLVKQDGVRFWARLEATVLADVDGVSTCRIVLSDITARKQVELALRESHLKLEEMLVELQENQERLMQQERLAAVGQLAAGIAHDFNNILASIVLYTQLSLHDNELSPAIRKRLKVIAGQADSAAELVQQILDFGRRAMIQKRPLPLNTFLAKMVDLIKDTLPERIQLNLAFTPDEYMINADSPRIQQAILNLAFNARDAMPGGGQLNIRLSRVTGEAINCALCDQVADGEWIEIQVTDNGKGIPPETLPHIFEPFFTTKNPAEGTGLGLAQVYGIVAQHGGHLNVTTQVGVGTTFHLYFPPMPIEPPEKSAVPPTFPSPGQGEKILVVEDNQVFRETLLDSLEFMNYRCLAAADGREALDLLAQQPEQISLVLSDMVMPNVNGLTLLRKMRQEGFKTPVVILSGHPLENDLAELQALGLAGWLLKPVEMTQLSRMLMRALS